MPLAIDEAMMRIQQIQMSLAITQILEIQSGSIVVTPFAVSVKKAYPYFPDSSEEITDTPCFINQWTAPSVNFNSVFLSGEFSVHMQLLCEDSDTSRAAAIASAFYPKLLSALATKIKLNEWGPATVRTLRGVDPTLASLEFGGKGYVGLDLNLDIYLNKAQVMEP